LQQPGKKISDQQILDLLKNEATYEKGFRLLMQTYQERLYWHIRKMVYEHEDANDVIQNTFVKVFKSIKRFEGKSKLYTWLYRIATNESITYINKKKRKSTASLDDDENNSIAGRLKADVYFDGDEIQLKLQEAISKLPEKQKKVFNLRYFEELSYQEIADILDTSGGALKASYHHAAKKVQAYLRTIGSEI